MAPAPSMPPWLPPVICTPDLNSPVPEASGYARVAFSPDSFVIRLGDEVPVNVSLSDPIIAPSSSDAPYLFVSYATEDPRIRFDPSFLHWNASQWAETRTVHVAMPIDPYMNDVLNATRACTTSNSELYMGYEPRFDVSVMVYSPPPSLPPPPPSVPPAPPSPPPLAPPHDAFLPTLTISIAVGLGTLIFVVSVTIATIAARSTPRAPRATDIVARRPKGTAASYTFQSLRT